MNNEGALYHKLDCLMAVHMNPLIDELSGVFLNGDELRRVSDRSKRLKVVAHKLQASPCASNPRRCNGGTLTCLQRLLRSSLLYVKKHANLLRHFVPGGHVQPVSPAVLERLAEFAFALFGLLEHEPDAARRLALYALSTRAVALYNGYYDTLSAAVPTPLPARERFPETLHSTSDAAYVDELLQRGMPINGVDTVGNTALSDACVRGHDDKLRRLLALGADPNIPNANGYTVLHHAISRDCQPIVDLLVTYGADLSANINSPSPNRPPSRSFASPSSSSSPSVRPLSIRSSSIRPSSSSSSSSTESTEPTESATSEDDSSSKAASRRLSMPVRVKTEPAEPRLATEQDPTVAEVTEQLGDMKIKSEASRLEPPQGQTIAYYKTNGYTTFLRKRMLTFHGGSFANRPCHIVRYNGRNTLCFFPDDQTSHYISCEIPLTYGDRRTNP